MSASFAVQGSDCRQQRNKEDSYGQKHIERLRPMDTIEKNLLDLYPDDEREGHVNTARPGPVHIREEI